jgi:hypothetical protein
MIINMIIAGLFLLLAGLIVLEAAIKNATNGYQDEFGFHEGLDPQQALTFGADLSSAIAGHMVKTVPTESRARPSPRRSPRNPVEAGSVSTYPY